MNDILPQPDCSTTLSSDDIITISSVPSVDFSWDTSTMNSITLPTGYINSVDTITVSNIDLTSRINWNIESTEFVNCFPDWSKVAEMRAQYPGLDIAMKKFEEVYKMVEDDWEAQQGRKYGINNT